MKDGVMFPTPSYETAIEAFDICILRTPADLQLTANGDIAVHDGDLKVGGDKYNAMFRLVNAWRFNAPMLRGLFGLFVEARTQKRQAEERTENVVSALAATGWSAKSVAEYHLHNDEIGASELGAAACAGAIFVLLNNLLQRFRHDSQAKPQTWDASGPLINAVSIGSLIASAANNFRHHDEWRRAKKLNRQQLASVSVLQRALNNPLQSIKENVCAELLELISQGRHEKLNEMLFQFAKSVAEGL